MKQTYAPPPSRKDGSWPYFVAELLAYHGWDNTQLARRAGFDRSMVGRWISGETKPTIESIRVVCRAAGVDIREGLIAAGLFTEAELSYNPHQPVDWSKVSDEALLEENHRRMRRHLRDGRGSDVTTLRVQQQDGQDEGYRVSAGLSSSATDTQTPLTTGDIEAIRTSPPRSCDG